MKNPSKESPGAMKFLSSRNAPRLELEIRTSSQEKRPLKHHLSSAASGECCANNSFNFGIQIGAGVTIIARDRFCRWHTSRPCELHRQIADDSTKHQLSDQNGGAGDLSGIGIGGARLDVSLEATKHDTVLYRASSCRRVRRTLLLSTIGGRKRGDVFQYHSWRESSQAVHYPKIG